MKTRVKVRARRYHDFSAGHRVHGHESKCALLHGHNYRAHFHLEGQLDTVGRVLDFSAIKQYLSAWLEANWDHKFLAWEHDTFMWRVKHIVRTAADDPHGGVYAGTTIMLNDSIVWTPFNPTAENMAIHLLTVVGPEVLPPHVRLVKVVIDETRKCSASAEFCDGQ